MASKPKVQQGYKKGKFSDRSETEELILQYLGGKEEQDSAMSLMTGHTVTRIWNRKKSVFHAMYQKTPN